ncbi:MAG TPA: peptidoglycan DD-metalloendopeptidase family protein [Rhodanobacter sp.]
MKKLHGLGMLANMNRYLQMSALATGFLMLAACGTMRSSVVVEPASGGNDYRPPVPVRAAPARTPIPGGSYEVKKGETLYSIAFRNGVDFRDLAQWNAIAPPYTIWPGQRLKLSPSGKMVAAAHAPASVPAAAPVHAASAPPAASAPMFEPVPETGTASAMGEMVPSATSSAPVPAPARQKPAAPAVSATAPAVVPVAGIPTPLPATLPPPAPAPVVSGAARSIGGVNWRWPAQGALLKRFQNADAIPGIEIGGKAGDPVRAAADGVVVYSGNGLVGYGELVIIKHNDSFLSAYGHNSKRLVKEGQRVTAGQQVAEMGSTGASRDELEFQIRKDGNPVDPLGFLPSR